MSIVKLMEQPLSPRIPAMDEVNAAAGGDASWQDADIERLIIDNSANFSVKEYAYKLSTNKLLSNPNIASNLDALLDVQRTVLDYGLQMSLASALTRKAIGALEGLLRG